MKKLELFKLISPKICGLFMMAGLLLLLSISSCSKQFIEDMSETVTIKTQSAGFVVPIDDALAELESVLAVIDKQGTKGKGKRTIQSIEVSYNTYLSKKLGLKSDALSDTLFYVVNFADDNGYAVLSADKRISEAVLIVSDDGNIAVEDFNRRLEPFKEPFIYDFGDGETLNLWNEENQDYYVGGMFNPVETIGQIVMGYAVGAISASDITGGGSSGGGSSGGSSTTKVTYTVKNEVRPLMTTLWTQSAPFNTNCPSGKCGHAPAGCVPIAVAQIMAYHEHPKTFKYDGKTKTINWAKLKEIYSIDLPSYEGSEDAQAQAAELVRAIGLECWTVYNCGGSFATPARAKACLKDNDFGNYNIEDDLWGYKAKEEKAILNSLNRDCPVFIAAISGSASGHAWNIDGYIDRDKKTETIKNGQVTKTITENELLMHCNFGWKGYCNGYYFSGIFNTKEGPIETEYDYGANFNPTWWFRVITTKKPN